MNCDHTAYTRDCARCRSHSAEAARRRRAAIREGRYQPQVPADHVRPHIQQLRGAGMAATVIAARANLSRHTIHKIANGHRTYVSGSVAAAILAVEPEPVCRVIGEPAVGIARRIQALGVERWSLPALADRTGVSASTLWYIAGMANNTVAGTIAAAVRDVYDELYATEGPSEQARRNALRRGWLGPEAWTEDSIDDPYATPRTVDGEPDEVAVLQVVDGRLPFKSLREVEKLALFRNHVTGWTGTRAMKQLRMSSDTVAKWRARAANQEMAATA